MKRPIVVTGFAIIAGLLVLNLGAWLSAPATEPVQADLIVSLGGDSGERSKMAIGLYKAGFAKTVLLTGMEGGLDAAQRHYVNWRTQYMLESGVPAEALLFDDQSANTFEEAHNTAALMQAKHWQTVLVVSDPPHMRRLQYSFDPVFKNAGLDYRLIQTKPSDWHVGRWWHDEKWA